MLFNSLAFLGFFAIVYPLYLLLRRRHRLQNAFLLLASLVFYGFWDVRFLALMAVSTGIDYYLALRIEASSDQRAKRRCVAISVALNLLILGFFKYFGFFADSTVALLNALGASASRTTLEIVLPVGVSFYTFQAISYVVDVYRGDIRAVRSPLDYGLFIAFFPHLVAGPIQRPVVLLPQIIEPRKVRWDQVYAGLFLIAWGYYKKVVIADNMALVANPVFDSYQTQSGLDLALGALAFTFQIYGDFSGYSDIARGLSKLLGFELLVNFNLPYFARSPADFWRRWHVSLSTWLRDYLYIPLGGSRGGRWLTYRNLFLTMLLGGLWHGAAWNFVLWGAFHGAILIAYRALGQEPRAAERSPAAPLRYAAVLAQVLVMFALTVIGWILFRSRSLHQAVYMVTHLGLSGSERSALALRTLVFFVTPLFAVQLFQYARRDLLAPTKLPTWALGVGLGLLLAMIPVFGVRQATEFIYFQF
jgi:D-alanyl-lipoteichoic acid acyltransferase DltB (MBOAT superfamily)